MALYFVSFLAALALSLRGALLARGARGLPSDRSAFVVSALLIAFSLIVCFNTAYARICGGLELALATRYVTYIEPAVLGVYLFLNTVQMPRLRSALLIGGALATILVSFRDNPDQMLYYSRGKSNWKACYLKTHDIEQCNRETGFLIQAGASSSQEMQLQPKLQYLETRHLNFASQ